MLLLSAFVLVLCLVALSSPVLSPGIQHSGKEHCGTWFPPFPASVLGPGSGYRAGPGMEAGSAVAGSWVLKYCLPLCWVLEPGAEEGSSAGPSAEGLWTDQESDGFRS